ncbi:MAG: regulator [Gammaproteobacteria bacterium]|nr:regulator [Gammaproteobacteria bacterium]MCP5425593.1 regulator [Gammaproteobacteria bacterium]MCP5459007.1 regulator [Gammaproteobacteria bacterium]
MKKDSVSLWTPGDWNALFGLGTNVLVNLLVMTGLLKFVLQMPDAITFGRILPAVGLMLFMGNLYYAFMAYRLARKTGRADVCALPSGPSVPHMFIVVMVIMLPILSQTGDPVKAWEAGMAWVFMQGFILIGGGFIAPIIRKITPRAALLGTLAGVSIAFISMRPAMEIYMTPAIGLLSLAIILVSWFGGVRYPRSIPAGLVAIGVGTIIAWISTAMGWGWGGMDPQKLLQSFTHFGFTVPLPAVDHVFSGFQFLGFILVTAIPFGVYDLVEAMDNVESAEAAGDTYSTTEALAAEGTISLIGTLMGSPFANAVYIGHPGWKEMGGRIGYSIGTGVLVLSLTWLNITSLLLNLIPVVAILPILLYIGALIGAQAFQSTPTAHAPAIIFALVPHLAAWAKVMVDGALGAAGTSAQQVGLDQLANVGVLYQGLSLLGGGAILTGLVLGATVVFVIERQLRTAAAFALAGAVLTYFGFMHGPAVGFGENGLGVTPMVTLGYLLMSAFFMLCASFAEKPASEQEPTRLPGGDALAEAPGVPE